MSEAMSASLRLPSQLTPFVGRQDALTHLLDLIANPDCRLLSLVGPGGIGKTQLAIHTAAKVLELSTTDVFFVPLQPLASSDLIISAVVEALGLSLTLGSEPKEQLIKYLNNKSTLLVLDNFEHLLNGTPLISELLAQIPTTKLLITSRERLNLREEWIFEVNGLSFPTESASTNTEDYSAVQLFVQNARRINPGFSFAEEADAINRICRLLEGTPLALELASSWVHVLSCSEIAEEIEYGLDILETKTRDTPARHRNMRAVFDHSWNLLPSSHQDVFKRLAVFRGGFTRDAAAKIANASLPILAALVEKSWLRHHPAGRYYIHELLRQYGEEQLFILGDLDTARDAHSAYYADFLQQRWRPLRTHQQVVTLNQIESEFENVRTAWHHMVEKYRATELSSSIYSIWLYCDLRCRFHEAIMLFEQAEDALCPAGGLPEVDRLIGQLQTQRGWFYVTNNKLEAGRDLVDQGLAALHRVGTLEDIAMGYFSHCNLAAFRGDPPALRWNSEQIIEIARRTQDHIMLAMAMFSLANAAAMGHQADEARRLTQQAYDLAEHSGNVWLRSMTSGLLAGTAFEAGNYTEAKRLMNQSLELADTLGQFATIGAIHISLAAFCLYTDDLRQAAIHYHDGFKTLAFRVGVTHHVLHALISISERWIAKVDKERAVQILTLVLYHPDCFHVHREEAKRQIGQLKLQMSRRSFEDAEHSGRLLEINQLVQDLMAELLQTLMAGLDKTADAVSQPEQHLMIDPLTKREQEILRLLADGLSNHEIAKELVISVGTVKAHTSSIYSKLHASNRLQAVTIANKLALF
jgi:predicted ATPase/DNA-binding NarL/FixJ family response regulator